MKTNKSRLMSSEMLAHNDAPFGQAFKCKSLQLTVFGDGSSSWNSLDENRLLSEFQYGFRSKVSTGLAATLFLDNIRKDADQGEMVGATFIDLSKALDTINHLMHTRFLLSISTIIVWLSSIAMVQIGLSLNASKFRSIEKHKCHATVLSPLHKRP